MPNRLIWLPQVLLDAGLKVSMVKGWEDRGVPGKEMGKVAGVICHHTATQAGGNMPTLQTIIKGRSDLSGPLSHLRRGRDGTFYVIAAGFCHHAGTGEWKGITSGDRSFVGIEAENRGTHADFPWPEVQMEAYAHGLAAILKHIAAGPEFCVRHREWALPAGRKTDPVFSMTDFRAAVARAMGSAEKPPLIAARDPAGRPTLRRGMTHPLVREVKERLGVSPLGIFGPQTEAAVRAFQRHNNVVPDGIVGPRSWALLDAAPAASAPTRHPSIPAAVDMPLPDAIGILRDVTGSGTGWGGDTTVAVQRALGAVFLLNPIDDVDGAAGPRTRAAWQLFRGAAGIPDNAAIDVAGARALADAAHAPDAFLGKRVVEIPAEYEFRRNHRETNRAASVDAIAAAAKKRGVTRPQLAYMLATAEHESDRFGTLEEYASGAAYEGRADLGNRAPATAAASMGVGTCSSPGAKTTASTRSAPASAWSSFPRC